MRDAVRGQWILRSSKWTPIGAVAAVVLVVGLGALAINEAASRPALGGSSGADPVAAAAQLVPDVFSSPGADQYGSFGWSVATSGALVVVGAPNENSSGVYGAGNAYVFDTKTGVVTSLASPNAQAYGSFGYSVAVSGTTVAVGAPYESVSGHGYAGRVYLFNTVNSAVTTLVSPNAQADGFFGFSVAMSGTTLVIGAYGETASGYTDAGHAYVVDTKSGLTKMLSSPSPQAFGRFGFSVAVSGASVAIGAPLETVSSYTEAGQAYTFNANSGDQIATFSSPNAQQQGEFGNSIAVSGATVAVGAPDETGSGYADAGNAYLIDTATSAVTTLTSPNAQTDGFFGQSVAISGSYVAVGASGETDQGVSDAGNAYSFSIASGPLILGTFTTPNPSASGEFGWSIAFGGTNVVTGAPNEDASGESGAGHAYLRDNLPLTLASPNTQADGLWGSAVAISGSLLAIGAPGETAAGLAGAGHAYIVDSATGGVTTLASPNAQTSGSFGASVGISGTTLIVGAPDESVSGTVDAGHAYLFSATTGSLIATLTSPNEQTDGLFGTSVAISGSTAVVGAPGETASTYATAGNAYTFNAASGALRASLTSPNAQAGGAFGQSAAISGTVVVVGAPFETAAGDPDAGHAYSFNATSGAAGVTLKSGAPQVDGQFGTSVAIGAGTIVVGAPDEAVSSDTGAGHAYAFKSSNGARIATFTSPNAQVSGGFGRAVAINGTTVVVGAPCETAGGYTCGGNVYTFVAKTGVPIDHFYSPNVVGDGFFGNAVAISGPDVLVGASHETATDSDAGHAYLM